MKMTASEAILNIILENGTDVVFGYPGSAIAPVYDALSSFDKIKHVLPKTEQSAAHAASGYAKSSGKVGVCIATSGPGATNLITGIATAYSDSVPMVAITGQVHSDLVGRDAFQEVDITGATNPFCKHNYLINSPDEIVDVLREAFYIASTGRKGPVLVDIPTNYLTEFVEFKKYKEPNLISYKPNYKGNTLQIKRAIDCLKKAKRPLLYIGGGCCDLETNKELKKFIEKTSFPAVTTLKAVGAVPFDYPLNFGMIGTHGKKVANYALSTCDTLMILGARIGDRSLGKADLIDEENIKVIHIDIDPAEIGKNMHTNIPVVGLVKNVLSALNEKDFSVSCDKEWIEALKIKNSIKNDYPHKKGFVNPEFVIECINRITNGNSIVSTEVGQNQIWAARNIKINSPLGFITSGGLGTMGFGLPAAIGAAFANKDKSVIAIEGDGSLMMSLAELSTIASYNLNIKIILFNNNALGMIREYQKNNFGENYFEVFLEKNPDFTLLSKSFGIKAKRVDNQDEISDALKEAFSYNGSYLLEINVDPMENSII
ncbi:MAG: biosynthetic-type acetolactate synthase large subunit [Ruminococcaceae bacterium]|nr:biosynthetic-type acetolactate synthase large subunit [Oscillospiraceae bacterium]